MNFRFDIFVNIGLRGAILISKFLFIFVAARYLSLDDLGTYSLFGATIGYALYLLGLDFYTFATREIIGHPRDRQAVLIADQFRLYIVTFVALFIPLSAIFWAGLLDWKWLGFFYALLLCEHLSQEITRLLIALSQPLLASLLLFIRTASWAVIVLLLFMVDPVWHDIFWILVLWLTASALSVVLGLYSLRFVPWLKLIRGPLPTAWWWSGIKVAIPFLLSTLAIRSLFLLDRYAIEFWDGVGLVGVYAVYFGLCNAMSAFIDSAVIQFAYPRLVGFVKSNDAAGFGRYMLRFGYQVVILLIFCICGFYLLTELFLSLIGKEEYLEYLYFFWWLLAAHVLRVLTNVPHYGLYAMRRDKWIFSAHLCGFMAFLICLSFGKMNSGFTVVVFSSIVAFALQFFIKSIGFYLSYGFYMNKGKVS